MSATRILVVEDEAIIAEELVRKLGRLGYEIAGVTTTGEEAVSMAGRLAPDLALMDIQLEDEMDGVEAADAIGREYGIPVIFLTAHSDAATLSRAKVTGAFGYILKPFDERDLTTQIEMAVYKHRAEEALRKSEQKFRLLFENSPLGVLITVPDGTIIAANTAACHMFEMSEQEVCQLGRSGILEIDDPVLAAALKQRAQTGKVQNIELTGKRKSGEKFPVEVDSVIMSTEPVNSFVILRDITERKQAEEALRENEKRLSDILEQLPAGVGVLNRDGRYVLKNSAMQRYMPRSIMPSRDSERIDQWKALNPDGQPLPPDQWPGARALRGETASPGTQFLYTDENGKKRYFSVSAAPLRSMEGEITGAVSVMQDFTERKRIEDQLQQAQRMEVIGRLAGGVAHEFNNFLNVIHGNAELLRFRLGTDSPLLDYVQEITDAAQRSASLSDQLLTYSCNQVSTPELIDLNLEIHARLSLLEPLSSKSIDIRFQPADAAWPVRVDLNQLEQILVHLVDNAVDAIADTGNVTLATENVRFHRHAPEADLSPGDYVRLSIADTGAGMDRKTRERIFDPFFTTKDVGRGTGLGLPTIYGIVKQNHGGITVESEPGKGSTFHIFLPRAEQ